MEVIMSIDNLTTIKELENFLHGSQYLAYSVPGNKGERYKLIEKLLVRFRYRSSDKKEKGILIRFLMKLSGYSRAQVVRLIGQYRKTGRIAYRPAKNNGFQSKYNARDIRLLADLDELHETPCGHAVKKLAERACTVHGESQYENLATISVSHLYNLRASVDYQRQRRHFEKTHPTKQISIGERRKPHPLGKPGFIRIDTVHQGDQDGRKGIYHINAVDEITQFEVVLSAEKISEQYLLPVITQMLEMFPFVINGFHSDNGSEYVNAKVARLLNKLLIEFTKSRARKSNDNALIESKNASVVRKQFGYTHIPQKWAATFNAFNKSYLFPYINYHRPCFFPETVTDNKGKQRKRYEYKNMHTPYDRLKSLADSESFLKEGLSFEQLDQIAMKMTDNEAAKQLKQEKQKLFNMIFEQKKQA